MLQGTCTGNLVIKTLGNGSEMDSGDPPKNVVIDYMDRYKDKDRGFNTAAANIAVTENSPMLSLLTGGIVSSQSNGKGSVVQKAVPQEDKLICGQCSFVCCDVKDFLEHKSTHVGHKKGLGCDLCGLGFSRQKPITEHYKQKHRVALSCSRSDFKTGCETTEKEGTESVIAYLKTIENLLREDHTSVNDTEVPADTAFQPVVTSLPNGYGEPVTMFATIVADTAFTKNEIELENKDDESLHYVTEARVKEESHVTSEIDTIIPLILTTHGDENIDSDNRDEDVKVLLKPKALEDYIVETPSTSLAEGISTNVCNSDSNTDTSNTSISNADVDNTNVSFTNEAEEKDVLKINSVASDNGKNSQPVDSDFHFISNIEIMKGKSLCYGKHEFKCLHCSFKTQWRNKLYHHMAEKHSNLVGDEVELLVNSIADKAGAGQKVLKMSEYMNVQKKGKGRSRGVETQDLPGDFPCSVCGKVYHRLRYLRSHMKRHTVNSNLLCSECGKAFKTQAYLAQHLKTHRTKEMYQCSQCEFSSAVNTLIHAHIQIHKEGCLTCEICGQAFTDKSTLHRHKRVHDKSRPFACKFEGCTLRFKKEITCNGHYKQHFTKGKFECNVCGYIFRQKHHLLRHEKMIHKLSPVKTTTRPSDESDKSKPDIQENLDIPLNLDVPQSESTCMDTGEVNLIVNEDGGINVASENTEDQFDLESALQSGQLVIATDEEGNPVNYEMSDIGMNVAYQTLLHGGEGQDLDAHTILIPQADANQIVFEEVTETVGTYVES